MIDKIVISKNHCTALIYFTTGRIITLSHDQGQVLDLIAIVYSPLSRCDTWAALLRSNEETSEIDLINFNKNIQNSTKVS